MNKTLLALLSLAATLPATAHDGHGAATSAHWHATDIFGLLLVVTLAAAALWLSRK